MSKGTHPTPVSKPEYQSPYGRPKSIYLPERPPPPHPTPPVPTTRPPTKRSISTPPMLHQNQRQAAVSSPAPKMYHHSSPNRQRSQSVDASATTVNWRRDTRLVPDKYPLEISGSVFMVGVYNPSAIPLVYTSRRFPRHIVIRETGDRMCGVILPQRAVWLNLQLHSNYDERPATMWNAHVSIGMLPAPRLLADIRDPQRLTEAVRQFWSIHERDDHVSWLSKPIILPEWFTRELEPMYSSDESSEEEKADRDEDEEKCDRDEDEEKCDRDEDEEKCDQADDEETDGDQADEKIGKKKVIKKGSKTLGSRNSAKAWYDDEDTIELLPDDPFNEETKEE